VLFLLLEEGWLARVHPECGQERVRVGDR